MADDATIPPALRWAVWLIEKVGVPTAIAAYVLLSLGPKIDRLTAVIEQRIPGPAIVTQRDNVR